MNTWDKFLEMEPDPKASQRIMAAVEVELADYRRSSRRKVLLAWLSPALLGLTGLVTWNFMRQRSSELSPELLWKQARR